MSATFRMWKSRIGVFLPKLGTITKLPSMIWRGVYFVMFAGPLRFAVSMTLVLFLIAAIITFGIEYSIESKSRSALEPTPPSVQLSKFAVQAEINRHKGPMRSCVIDGISEVTKQALESNSMFTDRKLALVVEKCNHQIEQEALSVNRTASNNEILKMMEKLKHE